MTNYLSDKYASSKSVLLIGRLRRVKNNKRTEIMAAQLTSSM